MPNDTADEARSGYIAGLRALADLLEAHPEVRLPITGTAPSNGLHFIPCDREGMTAIVGLMTDPVEGDHDGTGKWHRVDGRLHGLHIFAMASADLLGGREVTRTRTVTGFEVEPFVSSGVPA